MANEKHGTEGAHSPLSTIEGVEAARADLMRELGKVDHAAFNASVRHVFRDYAEGQLLMDSLTWRPIWPIWMESKNGGG